VPATASRLRLIAIVAGVHFVAFVVLVYVFAASGGSIAWAGVLVWILGFPLPTLLIVIAPNASLGWGVFALGAANSAIWGTAISFLLGRRARSRRDSSP
jgi:hypothetical protein